MTTLDAAAKGRLAERLLPTATDVACLVHGDGGMQAIADVLDPLDRQELYALTVVLAAMVDTGAQTADLLAWIGFDEHGRPLKVTRNYRERSPLLLRPCGTRAAYARHCARGERPCEACSAAEREYQAERKKQQREDGEAA